MMFKLGLLAGHERVLMLLSSNQFFVKRAVWHGALSCWNMVSGGVKWVSRNVGEEVFVQ